MIPAPEDSSLANTLSEVLAAEAGSRDQPCARVAVWGLTVKRGVTSLSASTAAFKSWVGFPLSLTATPQDPLYFQSTGSWYPRAAMVYREEDWTWSQKTLHVTLVLTLSSVLRYNPLLCRDPPITTNLPRVCLCNTRASGLGLSVGFGERKRTAFCNLSPLKLIHQFLK